MPCSASWLSPLARPRSLPSTIPLAIGAICAAWEAGVKVPDDISMIGYDDVEMARFSSPPLTTIRHPRPSSACWRCSNW